MGVAGRESGRLTARCVVCGYDLSGTGLGGRCPECGEPAAYSLGDEVLLRFAHPAWLGAVVDGARALYRAAVLSAVSIVTGLLLVPLAWWRPALLWPAAQVLCVLPIMSLGLQTYGLWRMTTKPGASRFVAAGPAGACRVLAIPFAISAAWNVAAPVADGLPGWVLVAAVPVSQGVAVATLVVGLGVVRELMRRTIEGGESARSPRRVETVLWFLVVAGVLLGWVEAVRTGNLWKSTSIPLLFPLVHVVIFDRVRSLRDALAHEYGESRKLGEERARRAERVVAARWR